MCSRNDIAGALAAGMAALAATAGTPLAASASARVDEWSAGERRPARRPPAPTAPPDVYELGVPLDVQRAQPQIVDGQLAIEVIEVTEVRAASESAAFRRPDPWSVAPGESAPHGIAIARSLAWCDAIA
jgi:hypothetical protein